MGTGDKIKNKANELKGKIKKNRGRSMRDPELETEGHVDQLKANLKQAGEKVKDAFKR
ncbi:CsbD family protein [Pseudonocardia acaciae]|uniref:CsbD family protein n=1 Tax=Pseudonocardia acaciae TaxID=551276 RepID=UPI00056C2BD7|nr:CsbD family protein [Pseudonocardia acaciae]